MAERKTVNELLDRFEEEVVPTLAKRTQTDYKRHVSRLRREFGARITDELQPHELEAFMRAPEGGGPVQLNRIRAVLSSAYKRAVKWGWATHNVVLQVPKNPVKKRERNLTAGEIAEARKLAPPSLQLVMDLVMLTRQQQGKIIALRWNQVQDRVINFRHSKTKAKKRVEVEITPEIRAVLAECKKLSGDSEYVITTRLYRGRPYTGEGIRANWQRMMREYEKTGFDRFDFHDMLALAERQYKERQTRRALLSPALGDFPQFEPALTDDAVRMSAQYQLFYCLEQKVRRLVVERLKAAEGVDWWNSQRVPEGTRNAANSLRQKEVANGITPRSSNMIDYITFGELSGLITINWDVFESAFHHKEAVSRVIANLNLGRGPIAHCCAMTSHEVERLQIWVKDWFQQLK